MYSLRTSVQCLSLALCALLAGAASNAAFAQAGGSMGVSDTTHKMSGMKDGASKDKMGAKDKMDAKDKGMKGSGASKSHEMMDSKEKGGDAMGDGMMMKSDSGKMGDGMGMKGESKGKKSKKPKDSMSKDTTTKKP